MWMLLRLKERYFYFIFIFHLVASRIEASFPKNILANFDIIEYIIKRRKIFSKEEECKKIVPRYGKSGSYVGI